MVGIWVSIVSMVGIGKRVSVVSVESISISLGLGSGSGLSISRPLAIVVAIVVGIWVSIVSMVGIAKSMAISIVTTIEVPGISRSISLASGSGEHAQSDNGPKIMTGIQPKKKTFFQSFQPCSPWLPLIERTELMLTAFFGKSREQFLINPAMISH